MHVRLSPRPVVWSRQRRARRGAVSRPVAPWPFLGHPPPSLPQPAVPRPAPEGTPVASASPILNGMPRPRGAVLRAAPARRGALGGGDAGRASGRHRRARRACDRRAARKCRLFYLSAHPLWLVVPDQVSESTCKRRQRDPEAMLRSGGGVPGGAPRNTGAKIPFILPIRLLLTWVLLGTVSTVQCTGTACQPTRSSQAVAGPHRLTT